MDRNPEFEFAPEDETTARSLPPWKKFLLGVALLLGLSGAGLYTYQAMQPPPPEPQPGFSAQGIMPHQLQPGDSSRPPAGEQPEAIAGIQLGDWSTLLMKLGFSFVVGFAIAYAVAGMLKLVTIGLGLIFLLLFGLQYAGLIDINWAGIETYYDSFVTWIIPHIGNFKDFITSHLPASSMAALGLVIGFKK
jgi:uncharacterized membrane protein (Fun14 family)